MNISGQSRILVPLFITFFLACSAAGTELKNIEKITPQGSQEIDITGKVDLNGKSLTDSSGSLSLEGGNVEVPNGNLAVSGNTDGVDLDNPGTAITVNSNQYEVSDNSISVTELDTGSTDTRYLNRGGDAMNGDLNLNNYDVKKVSNLDVSTSSEQIASFSSTGIDFKQPLSLESSGPLSVANGVQLTGTSSNTLESYSTLYLTTSSGSPSDIVLNPTGQVGVDSNLSVTGNINPNGDLKVSNPSSIDNDVDIGGSLGVEGTLDLNDNELQNVLNIKSTSNNDLRIGAGGGGSDRVRIRDRANGKDIAEFEEGTQNVYIPNGDLVMSQGNALTDSNGNNRVKIGSSTVIKGGGSASLTVATNSVNIRGSTNSRKVVLGGGATDYMRLSNDGSQNVEIPNGNIDMNKNSINGVESLDSDGDKLVIDNGGVRISGGALDMNSNSVENINSIEDSSGNTMVNYDQSNRDVEINDNTGFQLPVGKDAY